MAEPMTQVLEKLHSTDPEERIVAARELATLDAPSMALFFLCLGDDDWRVRKAGVEAFFRLRQPLNLVSELIEFLHHQDNAGLRNAAIEILIGLGPLAVPALCREIACPDAEVRKFVIDILGEIGDDCCAVELLPALSDADINVRYAAAETLGKLAVAEAVAPLLRLMSDPDPGLKFTILQALANIGGNIPLEALRPYLDNSLLRKAIFDCFARIGGKDVVPDLVRGLSDPMRNAREAALRALDQIHAREPAVVAHALAGIGDDDRVAAFLEELLGGNDYALREAALSLYGYVGGRCEPFALLNCVADERLRSKGLEAFRLLGEETFVRLVSRGDLLSAPQKLCLIFVGGELGFRAALPLAQEGVLSAEAQQRRASARVLGRLAGSDDVVSLLRLLDDDGDDIRDAATMALAELGGRYPMEVLRQTEPLLTDRSAEKRMRMVRVLGLMEGEGIAALLLKAFKDADAGVRGEAIRALQGRHSTAILAGLTLALTDESAEVRRLAVDALGRTPRAEVLPALKLAIADADLWVRAAVMRALESFDEEEVRELLLLGAADTVGLVVIAALETAAIVMPANAGRLAEQALAHADEEVVKSAMALLGRLRGADWIAPFQCALLNHSHWDVRVHAAQALAQSGLPEARQWLESRRLVEGERLVLQALEAAIQIRLAAERPER